MGQQQRGQERAQSSTLHNVHYRRIGELREEGFHMPVSRLTEAGESHSCWRTTWQGDVERLLAVAPDVNPEMSIVTGSVR